MYIIHIQLKVSHAQKQKKEWECRVGGEWVFCPLYVGF